MRVVAAQRKLVTGERFDRRHVASVAARWLDGGSRPHMLRAHNAYSCVEKSGSACFAGFVLSRGHGYDRDQQLYGESATVLWLESLLVRSRLYSYCSFIPYAVVTSSQSCCVERLDIATKAEIFHNADQDSNVQHIDFECIFSLIKI